MRKLLLLLSAIFLLLLNSKAQKTVTGKVTDDQGKALSNVSIIVKGSTTGATTASDGTYSITVPADGKTLEFSFLDYETAQVKIGSRTEISLSLHPSVKDLTEVVVTGISRVKKSQFAGATTRIDSSQLQNKPVGSFDQILQGRSPGVLAVTGSGAPGSSSTIIIRGAGTIEGTTDPLYVIDGIPVEPGVFQGYNPNDFASIEILRDAASTALYGSRGSAGVIVITTKRGVAGKTRLGYSLQLGVKSKPDFAFRPMNTTELLKAQHDVGYILSDGGTSMNAANTNINIPGWYYSTDNPRFSALSVDSQARIRVQYDSISKINTNWTDEIFRNGQFSNHLLTLSGGTGKTKFYSSLGFYNETGTTLRSDMKRATLVNNIDYSDDKFAYTISMNLGYTKRNFQQSTTTNSLGNPFLTSSVTVPYARVRNDDGSFATGTGASFAGANQLQLTDLDKNYNNQFKSTLGITLSYKILKDLTAALTTGVDFRETQNSNYGNRLAYTRTSLPVSNYTGRAGFQIEGLNRFLSGDVRPSLTYRKIFREKHDFEVSAYGEYTGEFSKFFQIQAFGVDPKTPNSFEATTQGDLTNKLIANTSGTSYKNALVSGLGLLRYTYNGKYTLTGSYRQDYNSKLPEDTRRQDYFSVGGIWEASRENFVKNINVINSLRLKLSYGSSGNSNNFPPDQGDFLENYPYQIQYSSNNTYNGSAIILPTYPGNPALKWETTYVTNLGIDFEVLKRRIYGDINLYNKATKDVLIAKRLSAVGGFGLGFTQFVNAGKIRNRGIEISLNADLVRDRNITWTIFGNFSYNKNRVISLGGEQSYETGTENITVGLPLGSHYEVAWAGVDAATGQPLYYTKDGKVTNVRSDDDRVQNFGTWEAPRTGGFGSSVKFKGFDLSILFSWESGSTKVDNMEYFVENPVGFLSAGYNQSSDLHFWHQPGDIVNTPSPKYGTQFSSKIIHDASFLRFRDATLSYTIPRKIIEKTKYVSNLKVFFQASNLFIWTKWRGRDPEAGATNINLSEYPNPRTFTGGLQINF